MISWRIARGISCIYRPISSRAVFDLCPRPNLLIRNYVEVQKVSLFSSIKEAPKFGRIIRSFKLDPEKRKKLEAAIAKQNEEKIPSNLYGKFRYYLHRYWHVALVVHFTLYGLWFGGFFVLVQSGVDIIGILKALHVPESWIEKIEHVPQGYRSLMVAFILCKLIAPLRYLSSIIGIRYTVSFLKKRNWLKTSKETSLHLREIHHSATIGARERIQKLRRNLNGSSLRKASDKRRTSLPKD